MSKIIKSYQLTINTLGLIKRNGLTYLREHARMVSQFIITIFFLGLGLWFFRHQQIELMQVRAIVSASSWDWLILGIVLTIIYIILQGLMYVASFAAVGEHISLLDSTVLFLKRNFVSVFLPAGGVSSLAFFTTAIERKGISKAQIHFASVIYAFVGILSVVLVAAPAFVIAISLGSIGEKELVALISVVVLMLVLLILYRSIVAQGYVFNKLISHFPSIEYYLDNLKSNKIERRQFFRIVLYSVIIELTGIAHIYIAMRALHLQPNLLAATLSYIVAVVFLILSPFLRGLGAIELSMAYLLGRFGFGDAAALSITLFYRLLEFWIPLAAGALSFLLKINKLIMRVFPALLLLILGVVNIVSVLTPAIGSRLHLLEDFIPVSAMAVSNYFVLITGLFLLVTAAFMLKGLRTAWYFALFLCVVSVVGNLLKAIDYEEALFAAAVMIILVASRKQYYMHNSRRLGLIGVKTMLLGCLAVLLYGFIGFYNLDPNHFDQDFNWMESVRYTFQNFFLLRSEGLVAKDNFARDFLYSLNISGAACISFLVYTLVRPHFSQAQSAQDDFEWARQQLVKYGDSSLDYFKTYPDKLFFRIPEKEGFLSYRIAGSFAVVLEGPVAPDKSKKDIVDAFDRHCFETGLKSIYYRVSEESLSLFPKKGRLLLGQEAVVDLLSFSLEGGSKKSIRNALKKVTDKGFHTKVYAAPIETDLLKMLRAVSDEWLEETGRSEIVFSQGMFLEEELRQHTIMTVEDEEGKVVAFLDIIPDYVKDEATFDLIRKTREAPNGIIDFITVEMFLYLKNQGYRSVNLGFAPLSGIIDPRNFPERSMKFAYEKIRAFSHYKGLRDYKDKFSPVWSNKYLVYDQDYDLFKVPAALTSVIKP